MHVQATLHLPAAGTETFFLWGPRQTGKTTLLGQTYPDPFRIDLLKAEEFLNVAALSDTELINFSTIARDCGVSSHTSTTYKWPSKPRRHGRSPLTEVS